MCALGSDMRGCVRLGCGCVEEGHEGGVLVVHEVVRGGVTSVGACVGAGIHIGVQIGARVRAYCWWRAGGIGERVVS